MAENLNFDALNNDELISRAESIKDSFLDIRSAVDSVNKALKSTGNAQARVKGLFTEVEKIAGKVAEVQNKAKVSSTAVADAIEQRAKAENNIRTLNVRINDLYERSLKSTGKSRDALKAQAENLAAARDSAIALRDGFEEIAEDAAKLNSSTAFFTGISNVVSDIPGLRTLSGPFQDAATAARDTVLSNAKSGKQISVMGAGMKGFAKSAVSSATSFLKSGGYVFIIVKLLQKLKDLFLKIDGNTSALAQNLNISKEAAAQLQVEVMQVGEELDLTVDRVDGAIEMMNKFASSTGLTSFNTKVLNAELESTVRIIGLSEEQTTSLATTLMATGQNTAMFRDNALAAASAMEENYGVALQTQTVFKDIAETTFLQRANLGNSADELGRAVVAARRLGLNLTALENSAGGFLDFESSITNELEAELFLNRELNLERARAAALQNDYVTLADEIAKNAGTLVNFQNMSYLAQEAFAKSLNMSREEVAEMLTIQQAALDAGFSSVKQAEDRYNYLVEQHGEQEAIRRLGEETAKGEFYQLKQNQSIQQQLNILMQNFQYILATGVAPLVARVARYLENNKDTVTSMVNSFGELVKKIALGETGIQKFFNILDKVGKFIVKISPVLNPIRFMGIADNVIDNVITGKVKTEETDDFIIRPGQPVQKFNKGDLVIGGTNLSGGSNKNVEVLLERIASAIESGGDVYIDGNKAGRAMVLASHKLS
jgi:hypothetical protein